MVYPNKQTRTNRTQPTYNFRIRLTPSLTSFIMASLTFTVVTTQRRNRNGSKRPQRTQNTTGVKTSSAWRRRATRPAQRKPRKTFCKVCFDAGEEETCYTSHFVKDRPGPNGKVVCPTLLSTECRYCHDKGHFKSHCPALAERKKQQESRAVQRQQEKSWLSAEQQAFLAENEFAHKLAQQHKQEKKQPVAAAATGAFAALDSDTSDDEEICYNRPAVARPRSPQGHWGGKAIPKPTYELSLQCDEELRPAKAPTPKVLRSAEEIEADLKEARKDISFIGDSWADSADREELEEKISDLEDELAKVNEQQPKAEPAKDKFGRPAADGSAW